MKRKQTFGVGEMGNEQLRRCLVVLLKYVRRCWRGFFAYNLLLYNNLQLGIRIVIVKTLKVPKNTSSLPAVILLVYRLPLNTTKPIIPLLLGEAILEVERRMVSADHNLFHICVYLVLLYSEFLGHIRSIPSATSLLFLLDFS